MKKKVLAVLLGGCMVVGMLAGCGSKADDTKKADGDTKTEGSGDSKGYHFEVVVKSFQSSYWQAAVQGINQACDELGVTANTTGPNAESDIADQVNMLNNAINKDPDGIALAACDQNSVLDSLQSALDKKMFRLRCSGRSRRICIRNSCNRQRAGWWNRSRAYL